MISSITNILLMSLSFKPCLLQAPRLLSQSSTKCFKTESISPQLICQHRDVTKATERQFPVGKRSPGNEAILDSKTGQAKALPWPQQWQSLKKADQHESAVIIFLRPSRMGTAQGSHSDVILKATFSGLCLVLPPTW